MSDTTADMTFLTIPTSGLRRGGVFVEIDNTQAGRGLASMPRKMLVVGQRLASGSLAALKPTRVSKAAQAESYFGTGSMLHRMALAIDKVRDLHGTVDTYFIAVDDLAAGVAATGTMVVAGAVTTATTFYVYMGGVRLSVSATVGDTAATLATKIAAAINAKSALPVTAAASNATVTVTALHKGTVSNDLELSVHYYDDDALPVGVTVTCTNLAGGAGDPDVGEPLSVITEDWYYSVICPYTDSASLATIESDMVTRWSGMNMRTGHVFNAKNGTFSGLSTFGESRNSPHVSTWGLTNCPTWAPERIAAFAATCHYYGTDDPAMPLRNLTVPGVLPPRIEDRFDGDERELLLYSGISTTTVDDSGNVILERVITNYQKSGNVDDDSLLRLETKWTADAYRYQVRARIALRFPRHKLAENGTRILPGAKVVTPQLITDEIQALNGELDGVWLQDVANQNKKIQVVLSKSDPDRVNAILPPKLIGQFFTFAAAVQYQL